MTAGRINYAKKFAEARVNFPAQRRRKKKLKCERKEKQVFHIYINDVNCLKSSGASLAKETGQRHG